jgi:hypothetical protein
MRSWLLACTSMDVISEGSWVYIGLFIHGGLRIAVEPVEILGTSIQLQQTKLVMAITARFDMVY